MEVEKVRETKSSIKLAFSSISGLHRRLGFKEKVFFFVSPKPTWVFLRHTKTISFLLLFFPFPGKVFVSFSYAYMLQRSMMLCSSDFQIMLFWSCRFGLLQTKKAMKSIQTKAAIEVAKASYRVHEKATKRIAKLPGKDNSR